MSLKYTANQKTWLKLKEDQAENLSEDEKHPVQDGDEFNVIASQIVYTGHQYVTFDQGYGPENRNTWFIFSGHFDNEASGKLVATFTPKGGTDQYGCHLYNLEMKMDGMEWNFECGSGQPGHKPVPVASDWPGSMNPIPQGDYVIRNPVYESVQDCDPGIGPIWIGLDPKQWLNGRAGFLIHLDYNWRYAPGTAGCIFPVKNRDMQTIADICAKASSGLLQVRYGL